MVKREDIEELKSEKPNSITYKMIAQASEGKVTEPEVKRFYSFRTLPFEKQLEIVKATKALIKVQADKVKAALAD